MQKWEALRSWQSNTHFSGDREGPQCDSCRLLPNRHIPAVLGVAVAASEAPVATPEELTAALLCCCWEKRELEDPEVGSGVAKLAKAPPR